MRLIIVFYPIPVPVFLLQFPVSFLCTTTDSATIPFLFRVCAQECPFLLPRHFHIKLTRHSHYPNQNENEMNNSGENSGIDYTWLILLHDAK